MRFRVAAALGLLALGLAACDKDRDAADGASLPAPEPAKFGKKTDAPVPASFSAPTKAADAVASLVAELPTGDPAPDPSLDRWSRVFDGANAPTATTAAFRPSGRARVVRAGMAIDTDGTRRAPEDPYWRGDTSLHYANGRALDAQTVPYVVIPINERRVKLGECVVVSYRGRSTVAIVGDRGPRFGEASAATARALGINPSGRSGGVGSGVTYSFLPGSCGRPNGEAELLASLKRDGPTMIAQAGGTSEVQVAMADPGTIVR